MRLQDKVIVVTGGGGGIGEGLCRRFAQEKPRGIVVSDINEQAAQKVARELSCEAIAVRCDVGDETSVRRLVEIAVEKFGRIDIFCSNAGIGFDSEYGSSAVHHSTQQWEKIWRVNVFSHVHALRVLLPLWKKQKSESAFMITASAAGLITMMGDASYSTTKFAAVGFAESAAIAHADDGVHVFCLCPQAVDTAMMAQKTSALKPKNEAAAKDTFLTDVLTPADVAECVVQAFERDEFLILPHKQVLNHIRNKANDHALWLKKMRAFRRKSKL